MGKYWDQPNKDNITITDTTAIMSQSDFDQLLNYRTTNPTGAYLGKMWRRGNILVWMDRQDEEFIYHEKREIIIKE